MEDSNQIRQTEPIDLANAFGEPNAAFGEVDEAFEQAQSFNANSTEASELINTYSHKDYKPNEKVVEYVVPKPIQGESVDMLKIVEDESSDAQLFSQLKNKAELFGVSSRQLETEFLDFKITKLMKKIDLLIDGNVDDCEIKGRINDARRLGLGSVTVAPTKIAYAKDLLENTHITVNSSIFINDIEQLFPVKLYAVKKLRNTPVKEIVFPVDVKSLKIESFKATEKQLKKIKRGCKDKKLKIAVDIEKLTQSELITLVKICLESQIETIVAKISESGMSKLKSLFALTGGRIAIEVRGEFALMFAVSVLALGINTLSIVNATHIADEIRTRLTSDNN